MNGRYSSKSGIFISGRKSEMRMISASYLAHFDQTVVESCLL
jgi:hypothetical protein